MNISRYFAAVVALGAMCTAMLTGCSEKKWHAEGVVEGASLTDLIVEAPNGRGGWYAVDTITTDKNGRFKASGESLGHPEVLRLTLDGQSVYFPIDSVESVNIEADAATFGSNYRVSGSTSADNMQKINAMIDSVVTARGASVAVVDPVLKRKLADAVLLDPSSAVAYYTIFRRVNDELLFDPTRKTDLRIIGAVANAFSMNRPADPRTKFLEAYFLDSRRSNNSLPGDTIVALEIRLPEIALLDKAGKRRSLNEATAEGKVVVLNFTSYAAEASPAFNLELAKVYDANRNSGLEIYQIAFDDDEFQWRQAAQNLPWITVYNSPADGIAALRDYNVTSLPALFIINRRGELVERVADVTKLDAAVKRYL